MAHNLSDLPPYLTTKIVGFSDLFLSEQKGFRSKSTMLIVGPPGAGKTTFALALARSLLHDCEQLLGASPGTELSDTEPNSKVAILYYLSLEVSESQLTSTFEQMGWFSNTGTKSVFKLHAGDETTLRIISIVPEFDRPIATSEEVTNALFAKLTMTLDPNDKRYVFVIVDSISALARDTGSAIERRRQTHELKARLESTIKSNGSTLALTMFLAERPTGAIPDMTSAVEEYLVDTVFRLDVREELLGRRLRTLEVVKSQGANMMLGEHTWAILSGQFTKQEGEPSPQEVPSIIFEYRYFGRKLREQALHGEDPKPESKWGTCVVFPRSRSLGFSPRQPAEESSLGFALSGTLGLDEMLNFREGRQFWHSAATVRKQAFAGGIRQGSITLLVGPPGTGKSTILLQFLFEAARNGTSGIYVTFDHDYAEARTVLINHWERFKLHYDIKQPLECPVELYAVRHSQVDINLILAQLRCSIIARRRAKMPLARIALDGLSEWLSTCNKDPDTLSLALEALLSGLKDATKAPLAPTTASDRTPPVTMMLAYETPVGQEALPEVVVGVPAQNILSLRQVQLAEATRRMIYVVKAAGQSSDPNPREVVFNRHEDQRLIEIRPGFDENAGLIEGVPKKATVVLQFFGDNCFEKQWNDSLVKRLASIRDLTYSQLGFTGTEIVRTLEETDSPTHFPPSDLKILEIDEWWIAKPRNYIAFPNDSQPEHPLLPLTDQWRPRAGRAELTSWREFWYVELEKAMLPSRGGQMELHAIPAHMDFAMFCVNLQLLGEQLSPQTIPSIPKDQHVAQTERIPQTISALPREDSGSLGITRMGQALGVSNLASACLLLARACPDTNGSAHCGTTPRRWINESKEAKSVWRELLRAVPRKWLPDATSTCLRLPSDQRGKLFESLTQLVSGTAPSTPVSSMVELGAILRSTAPESFLFAFDTSSTETCACLYFELAWANGAAEDFLIQDAHAFRSISIGSPVEGLGSVHGLFLAQFLVMAGYMPHGADVHSAGNALFSRQWYSTMMHSTDRVSDRRHPLMTLPFWPVASPPVQAFREALSDAETRLRRFLDRMDAALTASELFFERPEIRAVAEMHVQVLTKCREQFETLKWKEIKDQLRHAPGLEDSQSITSPSDSERLQRLCAVSRALDPLFDNAPLGSSFRLALNAAQPQVLQRADPSSDTFPVCGFADLEELWSWHTLRLQLLVKEASGQPLINALTAWRATQIVSSDEVKFALDGIKGDIGPKGTALVGQGATGSWMYAVHHSSRSVSIARDLIQELTSTRTVQERAAAGAGIPPRKDFYQAWGDSPVPSAEHLTWRDILRFNLVHARRRDRVLCRGIDAAEIYKLIREMLIRCLEFGNRNRWQDGQDPKVFETALRSAWLLAEQATREILATIANRMGQLGDQTCRNCPEIEKCRASRQLDQPLP